MVTNDLIVAIELGSSKIAGAVGRKQSDGSLQVLAYASEPASGFVRRGVVYNIDQTAQCLSNLINCLEPELCNATIEQVYVGVGGYTLEALAREKCGVKNVITGYVGPVIGAHTGPGVLVLFFLGSQR